MQTISHYHHLGSEKELDQFLNDPFFSQDRKSLLIQIFSTLPDKETLKSVVQRILSKIPDANVIGSSSSGEIHEGKMFEDGMLICASSFVSTSLKLYQAVVTDSYEDGKTMARTLITPKTKCIIAFADGLMVNGEKFLEGFNDANTNHIPIAGGMSADSERFAETYAFCQDEIMTNSAVAVALESDNLSVVQEYNLSWKAIGRDMIVTKSSGNCVSEINGHPILETYREFLGEEVVANIPASTIEIPLVIQEDGIDIARSMIGKKPDGSIIFAGEIREGSVVRFGVGSVQLLENRRAENFEILANAPSESIFIYSCAARKGFLGKTLEAEFMPFAKIAPVNGFFTYGEFFPSQNESKLLNITTTILSLSESTAERKEPLESPLHQTSSGVTTNALLHLVDKVVSDIQGYEKENIIIRRSLDELQESINRVLIVSKTDPRGIITQVNPLFCQISGYSEAELIGTSHNIIRHPNTSNSLFKNLWETIQSGKIWSGEIENRRKNGESYYVKSFIIPIHDEQSNIVEYLAIRQDITEMVEAKYALQKEQAFMQGIMDSLENIVMISANSEIKKLNKKFFELFPFANLEELTSKHQSFCELFVEKEGYLSPDDDEGSWLEDVVLYPHRIHKALMVDRWGRERVFSVRLRELYFETHLYQIVTLSDITQIEMAKIAADEAKNSRSDFLAAMSHEIRTPMNGIIGFVDLIQETNLDQKQQQYVDIIRSSSKTLLGIINEILDFSKIESGKMEIEYLPVELSKEMKNLYALFEANAALKSLGYHINIDDSIASCVMADILRLKQVLGNLIGNAIKFTPENGEVWFSISSVKKNQDGERIRFAIKDTGIGIPKEKQKKIFEAFSQADSSTTREFGGTGLGLTISAKIVAMMGSSLQVESEVGAGSTFSFEIDCKTCAFIPQQNEEELLADSSGSANLRILVAEDYEINRILMGEMLKRFGLEPDFVENGSEAVDKVMEKVYDVVFMDVNMPLMDGIEATKFIRQNDIKVPIIALTANAMEGDREKFLKAGMDSYLSKPINLEELEKVIRHYGGKKSESNEEEEGYTGRQNPIDYAQKELGLSRTIVEKLFAHFFARIDSDIDEIVQAMEDEKYDLVVDLAHRIRGSAANMRLTHIAETAKALEKTSHEHMSSKGKDYLKKIKNFVQDSKRKAGYES